MPLPSSGAISMSQIKAELSSASNSLRAYSLQVGFTTPDSMSEFYGYSPPTPPPTPPAVYSFVLNSTAYIAVGNDACADYALFNRATYYSYDSYIHSGTYLYTSAGGVGNSAFWIADGYRSDGTNYWYFGSGNTGDAGTPCTAPSPPTPPPTPGPPTPGPPTPPPTPPGPTPPPTPPYSYLLNNGGEATGVDACNEYNSFVRTTYYSNQSSITTGTYLYLSDYVTAVPDGYYSDGTNYWYFGGGVTSDLGTSCGGSPPPSPPPTPPPTPPSGYFYLGKKYDCASCTEQADVIIYSDNVLSAGSYYTPDGVYSWRVLTSTSSGSPADVNITGYEYTQGGDCATACANY